MGRPRKVKRPQETTRHVQVDDVPKSRPVVMTAGDSSAMELDLDLAFFDMNDGSFLHLMGADLEMNTPAPVETSKPANQPVRQPRSPGISPMTVAEHLAQHISFNQQSEPQAVSEQFGPGQAAGTMTADLLSETASLPAVSPQQSFTTSSQPSPPDPDRPLVCSCTASLYLALHSLQNLPKSVCAAINAARSACRTAYDTIACPVCSNPPVQLGSLCNPPIQSLQNMMMLGALLPSLSDAYRTILRTIDDEALAASLSSSRLAFDLSAYGGPAAYDGDVCGGRQLEPAVWRLTVRAVLKIDVCGLSGCGPLAVGEVLGGRMAADHPLWQPALKDVVRMMEERSRSRHEELDRLVRAGAMRFEERCEYVPLDNPRGEKPTCLRIIDVVKRSMQSLEIS